MDDFWPILIWIVVVAGQWFFRQLISKKPTKESSLEIYDDVSTPNQLEFTDIHSDIATISALEYQETPIEVAKLTPIYSETQPSDIDLSVSSEIMQVEKLHSPSPSTANQNTKNTWRMQPLSKSTWRQGIIMSVLLQAPRSLDPYHWDHE